MKKGILTLGLLAGIFSSFPGLAGTLDITPASRVTQGLVIYSNDLALINDAYDVKLPAGDSTLRFSSISPLLNPGSVLLYPRPTGLSVLSQSFKAAVTPAGLLENAVGKEVSLIGTQPQNGRQTVERARVVAVRGGLILEVNGRYETDLAGRRIAFDSLPSKGLNPSLDIKIRSDQNTRATLGLSYLTAGLRWQADYVARLNPARDRVQLTALATLENYSEINFKGARIELVAGTVNQQRRKVVAQRSLAMAADSVVVSSVAPLANVYLYQLAQPLDLTNNSTQQVALFAAREMPAVGRYRLERLPDLTRSTLAGEQKLAIDSYIEFDNAAAEAPGDVRSGPPMPAGIVRVYAQDSSDRLIFIGEDRVNHTPGGARVKLKTGRAFDLNARRRQLSYVRLPVESPFRRNDEVRIQTVLSNAGTSPVTIEVREVFAGQWRLLEGPEPDESDAGSARWNVRVPANGEATLEFTVRVKA